MKIASTIPVLALLLPMSMARHSSMGGILIEELGLREPHSDWEIVESVTAFQAGWLDRKFCVLQSGDHSGVWFSARMERFLVWRMMSNC